MKLYTRKGDDGSTGLADGSRVLKSDPRVAAYGTVDELNSQLGVALAMPAPEGAAELQGRLQRVQADLFVLGAELATPTKAKAGEAARTSRIDQSDVARLEAWIDEASADVPELREFILPGGHPLAAQLHLCRAVCRRAERHVVGSLSATCDLRPLTRVFLNRLSDLLFAWARWTNHRAAVAETQWKGQTRADGGA